jgi:thioredoxin 1
MTVHQITTPEQFDQVIKESLVIVDFNAEWCGPCKMIKPAFHALAKQHPQMKFAAVDIDQVPEAADKAQVSAMPTFQIYRGGNMIFEMKGADKAGLEQAIKVFDTYVESY